LDQLSLLRASVLLLEEEKPNEALRSLFEGLD